MFLEWFKKLGPEGKTWFALCLASVFLFSFAFTAGVPAQFPVGGMISIPEGATLFEIAEILKRENVISSEKVYALLVNFIGDEQVIAGTYFFEKRLNLFSIVKRTIRGDYNVSVKRLTFPEGMSIVKMAALCEETLFGCTQEEFIKSADGKEGFLFPDTYFFMPGTSAQSVVEAMEKNFERKITEIEPLIEKFGKPLSEVLTMASILEGEARRLDDRRAIAGILWKRIEIDMPLQVDYVFDYIIGRTTFELTLDDLKVDSPYNTYTNKGLPPTPVGNPGLESIKAAITPIKSDFLYYLTGHDGKFYYSKTFEGHLANKAKHLR